MVRLENSFLTSDPCDAFKCQYNQVVLGNNSYQSLQESQESYNTG